MRSQGLWARAVGALGAGFRQGGPFGGLLAAWGWGGRWQDVGRQARRLLQGLTSSSPPTVPRCPGGLRLPGSRVILGPVMRVALGASLPAPGPWKRHSSSVCPAQVTLECPGHEEVPRVDKLVEKILHCSCQACGKEPSHEGLSVYVQGEDAQGAQPGAHPHPHPGGQAPEPEDPPGAPHAEEEGAED